MPIKHTGSRHEADHPCKNVKEAYPNRNKAEGRVVRVRISANRVSVSCSKYAQALAQRKDPSCSQSPIEGISHNIREIKKTAGSVPRPVAVSY